MAKSNQSDNFEPPGTADEENIVPKFAGITLFKKLKPDFVNKINDDCLIYIFSMLPVDDRLTIERVCRRWKSVAPKAWNNFKHLNLSQYLFDYQGQYCEYCDIPLVNNPAVDKLLRRCAPFLTCFSMCTDNLQNPDDFDRDLNYYKAKYFTDQFLINLATQCPHLEHLNINDCPLITNKGIEALTNLKNFEALHCRHGRMISNLGIGELIIAASKLKFLDLVNCKVSSNLLSFANTIKNQRDDKVLLRIIVSSVVKENWVPEEILSPFLHVECQDFHVESSDEEDDDNDDNDDYNQADHERYRDDCSDYSD